MKIHKRFNRTTSSDLLASLATACILLGAQLSWSQVVNFCVPGGSSAGGAAALYVSQGALSDSGNNYWIPIVNNGTTPGMGTFDSDGITSNSIALKSPNLSHYAGNNFGGAATGPELLFTPFAYKGSGSYTLTLTNVPAGSYGLYLYSMNGSGGGGSTEFIVGGQSVTNEYDLTDTAFVQDTDYGVISNISPTSGSIAITVRGSGLGIQNPNEADFNGLQLVYPPAPPIGLNIIGVGNGTVTLSWTPPSSVADPALSVTYVVGRSTTSASGYAIVGGSGTTNFTDGTAINGVPYYYVVYAVNAGIATSFSSTQAGPATPVGPPIAPEVTATPGNNQVTLTFSSPSATSYNILSATTLGGPYTVIGTGVTSTNYLDSSATDSTSAPRNAVTQYYEVYAVNGLGTSPAPGLASATPPGSPAPATGVVATPGENQVIVRWTASATVSPGPITYNILESSTSGGTYTTIESGQTTTTYTDLTAADGTTNYYIVQALDDGVDPTNSTNVSASPPGAPSAPTNVTATAGMAQVTLTWNASAGLDANITYNIGRATNSGGPYTIINAGQSGTNYTDLAVTINENTYYYVVYALDDGVDPAGSAEVNATPFGPRPTVNFDVPGAVNASLNYSGLGAFPDSPNNIYWNPIRIGGTTSPSTNSDGVSLNNITLTMPSVSTYSGNNYGGAASGPELLFTPFSYNQSPYTMTLSNVPAAKYNLYVYGENGSDNNEGNSTAFTVNGVTFHTVQTTAYNNENFVLNASYVEFTSITPSNGTITIQVAGAGVGGNPNEADFNGIQLTPYLLQPPIVVSQPQSEELLAGSTAVFTTVASGGQLSYQWYTTNDVGEPVATNALSGTTNATLIISNVSAANATNYYCLASNNNTGAYQVTNSAAVTLTVVPPSGSFQAAIVNLNPLHYYAFDDTGNPSSGTELAFDYAGGDNGVYAANCENGNSSFSFAYANSSLTVNGIPGPRPSPDGFPGFASSNYAVFLQQNDPPCDLAVNSPWNLNTNTVTITAWINPASQSQSTGTVIVRNNGSINSDTGVDDIQALDYVANSTNGLYDLGYIWNNDSATIAWDSGLTPPVNQWSFVTLVVTPTNATISLMNTNGVLSSTFVHNHAIAGWAGPTVIGDNPSDVSIGFYAFDGTIDEVGIFDQALTQPQLENLFANAVQAPVFEQPATIASAKLVGGSLTLAITNGAAYSTYHVLTATNVSLSVTNWAVVTNGTFNANGSFQVSVPFNSGTPARFFSIKSP